MKVLFITRATIFEGFGGDSVQITSTAKYLRKLGVEVDIKLCNEKIDYSRYDLLHIFNIIRPADTLKHVKTSKKPYVISTIFVDYEAYEKKHRRGIIKWINYLFSKNTIEYIKTIARYVYNGEKIISPEYFWIGHKRALTKLANGASLLLPNSHSEYKRIEKYLGFSKSYKVIYNGIDYNTHARNDYYPISKKKNLVVCVARIEGNKNQLKLIEALNNTEFTLKIIGKPAPNHLAYYEKCKSIAAPNVEFTGFMGEKELIAIYQKAKVHILPSFSETCGLCSLEAAFHKCSLVITNGGDTQEYYGNEAIYCDPNSTTSILEAVRKASKSDFSQKLITKINDIYTWENAAKQTLDAYRQVLGEAYSKSSSGTNFKLTIPA